MAAWRISHRKGWVGSPMDLLLVRHGRSVADDEQRIEGAGYDSPLTDKGVEQARKLAARLQREGYELNMLLSSPLARAKRTAQIIAEALGIDPTCDERLAELHLGRLSGRPKGVDPYVEAARLAHVRFPEGESYLDQIYRVTSFWMELQDRHPQDRICVVAHGGTLNILIRLILGLPMGSPYWHREGFRFHMGDTAVSRFVVNGPFDVVTHFINDSAHLR